GAGAVEPGEVPQDHGLSEQSGQPAGADQQPCGADQPDGSVPGESAVQMAAAEDAGPLRGFAAGPHLEPLGPGRGQGTEITRDPPANKDASPYRTRISSSRVRMWWCSARSVEKIVPVLEMENLPLGRLDC